MDMLERARKLKDEGLDVVPVYGVGPDGTCKCPEGRNCGAPGKHPIGGVQPGMDGGYDRLVEVVGKGQKPNLGVLPQQSGLVVIDIDPRNGGDRTMADLVAEHGRLPDTRIVATGGGGWHYYFLAPEGVAWRAELGPGVDIKHNGMVVAAGSVSRSGAYTELSTGDIAEMPRWIIEKGSKPAVERPAPPSAPQGGLDPTDPDLPRRVRYARSAVESDLKKLDELTEQKTDRIEDYKGPHWNNTLYAIACNVFEFANTPETGMSTEEAYQQLFDRAPRDKGFTDERVRRTLDSARDGIGSTAREIPPPPLDPFGAAVAPRADGRITALQRMVGRQWKDNDVAEAFAEHYVDSIRYVDKYGWLKWSPMKGVWELASDTAIMSLSMDFVSEMVQEAQNPLDADLLKKAANRGSQNALRNVVTLAKSVHGLAESIEGLDADPELLNCPNGYVDLRTGRLIAHNPDKMMTKVTGCSYNPDATHPDVDEALKALDEEERDWLQLAFGQALLGVPPKEDFLLLLHGGGANGKSAVIGSLMAVAGTYAAMLSEKVLMPSRSDHGTEMTDLLGARIAVIEELPEAGDLSSNRIKKTVGSAYLTARKMHRDTITWQASHTIFITTNHKPRFSETDDGLWRRLAMLTFPYRFVASPDRIISDNDRLGDLGLRHRLTLEPQKEAFLAWAVRGAKRYLELGDEELEVTEKMREGALEWRHSVDPTGRFLAEMVVFDPDYCIPGVDLNDELKVWLNQNGHTAWSSTLMNSRFEQHHAITSAGVQRTRIKVGSPTAPTPSPRPGPVSVQYGAGQYIRVWTGMRWRTPADDEAMMAPNETPKEG